MNTIPIPKFTDRKELKKWAKTHAGQIDLAKVKIEKAKLKVKKP